jgi:hypothetical protein
MTIRAGLERTLSFHIGVEFADVVLRVQLRSIVRTLVASDRASRACVLDSAAGDSGRFATERAVVAH